MGFIQRAWLSITRKKGKSALLFFILLLVATLTLSGLSIKDASKNASGNLRKALGGGFVMEPDTSNPARQMKKDTGNGSVTQNIGGKLTTTLADKIAKVPGVKDFNAELVAPVILKRPDGGSLSLKGIEGSYFANDPNMNSQMTLNALTSSKNSGLFASGTLKLVEGRHITAGDSHVVLLHKEIAKKNNLKIGDKIMLSMNSTMTGGTASDLHTEATIIGFFESSAKQQVSTYGLPGELMENNVIMDGDSALADLYTWTPSGGYDKLHFGVKDPMQLEKTIARVKKLDGIDWSTFTISLDDAEYQTAAKPLKGLDQTVTTLLVIIIVVCTAVLCLLLTMWTKGRVREAGILLSMGVSKYKIIGQHLTEAAIIALVAFSLSFFSSSALAQGVGNAMLGAPETPAAQQTENGKQADGSFNFTRPDTPMNTGDLAKLKVTVKPATLCWVFGIGAVIILTSVSVSSIQILRVKPKELLTKMS
ncbi:FtsX-like permease family protein [Lactovum odontotermitis]